MHVSRHTRDKKKFTSGKAHANIENKKVLL